MKKFLSDILDQWRTIGLIILAFLGRFKRK